MASLSTTTLETDIYGMNDKNVDEKIKEHFVDIVKAIRFHQIRHAKVVTKIKELSSKQAAIYTEIDEEPWKINIDEIKKDEIDP